MRMSGPKWWNHTVFLKPIFSTPACRPLRHTNGIYSIQSSSDERADEIIESLLRSPFNKCLGAYFPSDSVVAVNKTGRNDEVIGNTLFFPYPEINALNSGMSSVTRAGRSGRS